VGLLGLDASSITSGSERPLGRARPPPPRGTGDIRAAQAGLGRLAQDRGDPGVRVLDVIDGVVARLLLGQLDVEVDAGRGAA
jgi:hypothetical protein